MLPFFIYKVIGQSMQPNFMEGDIVIGSRFLKPKIGSVIVLRDPRNGIRILKRVERINNSKLFVVGDNDTKSTDSNLFGYVSRKNLIGRIIKKF